VLLASLLLASLLVSAMTAAKSEAAPGAAVGFDSTVNISPILPEIESLLSHPLELTHIRNNAPVKRALAMKLRAAWAEVCALLGGDTSDVQRSSFQCVKKTLKMFSDEKVAVPEAILQRICSNEKCRAVQICPWSCIVR